MKLRNKKTGEVVNGVNKIGLVWNKYGMPAEIGQYDSLAELNANWEDYKPAEPLIKDEKIRKAVRAWAEACGAKQIKYSIAPNQYYDADMGTGFSIKFMVKPVEVYLEEEKIYTIDELCGEEKAPEPIEPTFIDLDERVKEKEEQLRNINVSSKPKRKRGRTLLARI